MSAKAFNIVTIALTIVLLVSFALIQFSVDPLFHYHGLQDKYQYPLYDERYMNYGIVKNFEYNSIITGTSMTENFMASMFDDLYNTETIKVPFAGGSYKEINDLLVKAYSSDNRIDYVLRSLDLSGLIEDKDYLDSEDYPSFLYDNNPFNDVQYLLNKEIYSQFTEYVFTFNRLGGNTTDFDTYKNWAYEYTYDADELLNSYSREEASGQTIPLSDEDITLLTDNLKQNVIALAEEHPETQFLLFDPPYSILHFDKINQRGELERNIEALRLEAQILSSYPNIHFYSFYDDTEKICDLNNYKDSIHYSQDISNYIMHAIACGEHKVTAGNLDEYYDNMLSFYSTYDYDSLISSNN